MCCNLVMVGSRLIGEVLAAFAGSVDRGLGFTLSQHDLLPCMALLVMEWSPSRSTTMSLKLVVQII
jgi:hypothetical protein